MNRKNIERFIPIAMDILARNEIKIVDDTGTQIDSKYFGYIGGMGPTIRQCGLLPAVAFYQAHDDRIRINQLLLSVLAESDEVFRDGSDLHRIIKKSVSSSTSYERDRLKRHVLEAIVACKLAIRTYAKKKVEKESKS